MSFTRFHDDPGRIKKQLQISSFSGRYMLDTPGPGDNMPYLEETQMRLQRWGANQMNNTTNLESDLRGLTRRLNRDNVNLNNYKTAAPATSQKSYPKTGEFVEESRASLPAWTFRDLEQSRWEEPLLNPQANLEKQFPSNIQTRILEKDNFTPSIPMVRGEADMNVEYYLTGRSMCIGGTESNCSRPGYK
jgi:hypothetical protein